jgi:uncharacterized damage-inducible protein DinB
MNAIASLLREHATVHMPAVADAAFHLPEDLISGLDEAAMRATPHGASSVVWLLWHIARVEDACIAAGLLGQPQVLDDPAADWPRKLGVTRRDQGEGMTRAEVAEFSATCTVQAVRDYRDAVGRHTRALVGALEPQALARVVTRDEVEKAIKSGAFGPDDLQLVGLPHENLLWWWGVQHSTYHIGQIALVRSMAGRAGPVA